jgi:hypothetical protein
MLGLGTAAAVLTLRRGEPPAVPLTLAYFALMEGLQLAGYAVVGQCGEPVNRAVTLLAYLHIALQPLVINAFAMELVPGERKVAARRWVYALCGLASLFMLVQLVPLERAGVCSIGSPLCGAELCTIWGNWHIGWSVPYNGLTVPLEELVGPGGAFPTYMLAVFLLPLAYGAWRFVLFHIAAGPLLASTLTDNPNEMPAIWCLFSVGILLIALSPAIRSRFGQAGSWARPAAG